MIALENYTPVKERISQYRLIRDTEYHFSLWGKENSPTILYLHGWGDTGSSFQVVVDFFADDWRVIAPDLRGFGRSQHNKSSYWFPDYLADVEEIKKIFISDRQFHIIGHSLGANIASMYAGIFPQYIHKFVNIEGFGLEESDPDNAPLNYRRWIEKLNKIEDFRNYNSFSSLADSLIKRNPIIRRDIALFIAHEWAHLKNDGKIYLNADRKHKLPNAIQYRRNEAKACWQRIEAESLLIYGEKSLYKNQIDNYKEALIREDGSDIFSCVQIKNSGHMIHLENPEKLALIIEKFLKGQKI